MTEIAEILRDVIVHGGRVVVPLFPTSVAVQREAVVFAGDEAMRLGHRLAWRYGLLREWEARRAFFAGETGDRLVDGAPVNASYLVLVRPLVVMCIDDLQVNAWVE